MRRACSFHRAGHVLIALETNTPRQLRVEPCGGTACLKKQEMALLASSPIFWLADWRVSFLHCVPRALLPRSRRHRFPNQPPMGSTMSSMPGAESSSMKWFSPKQSSVCCTKWTYTPENAHVEPGVYGVSTRGQRPLPQGHSGVKVT